MPPEAVLTQGEVRAALAADPWRRALPLLGATWLALIALFAPDWGKMFAQWWDSSTYNHVLLVPAILGWLVWLRLPELRKLTPRAWWPGLVLVALAVLIWVLGAFAGFDLLRQTGAAALLPATALLLLGPRVGAGLWFPLCYSAFLVPFGDELIPLLQTITAKITVALVHLSGIPAQIDGVFINTPVGLFEVAEACSGVKFLIAMIALGVLVGNVCFKRWGRRLAFMALCLAAPILANGVRAWGTIFAAQYVGVAKAAGIDHIIYGWIFFAIVIAAVLGLSWRFFDRAIDDSMIDAAAIEADPRLARLSALSLPAALGVVGAVALALGGQAWARAADSMAAVLPQQIFLPAVPGWHRVDYSPRVWWEPRAAGAEHRLLGRYADQSGHEVDVFVALYSAQAEGKEAGGFGEGALRPDSDWAWQGDGPPAPGAKSERLLAQGKVERVAQTWYRSGDLLGGSNTRLKLTNIQDRLLLRARPTMMLILSTEARPGHDPAPALAAFRQSTGDLAPWMDRIAQVR